MYMYDMIPVLLAPESRPTMGRKDTTLILKGIHIPAPCARHIPVPPYVCVYIWGEERETLYLCTLTRHLSIYLLYWKYVKEMEGLCPI